ncbi:hypothetical protein GBAR_LOCUS17860, partial [Geodia barretti]
QDCLGNQKQLHVPGCAQGRLLTPVSNTLNYSSMLSSSQGQLSNVVVHHYGSGFVMKESTAHTGRQDLLVSNPVTLQPSWT